MHHYNNNKCVRMCMFGRQVSGRQTVGATTKGAAATKEYIAWTNGCRTPVSLRTMESDKSRRKFLECTSHTHIHVVQQQHLHRLEQHWWPLLWKTTSANDDIIIEMLILATDRQAGSRHNNKGAPAYRRSVATKRHNGAVRTVALFIAMRNASSNVLALRCNVEANCRYLDFQHMHTKPHAYNRKNIYEEPDKNLISGPKASTGTHTRLWVAVYVYSCMFVWYARKLTVSASPGC